MNHVMNRRQFLSSSLFFLTGGVDGGVTEDAVREKVEKARNLSLEHFVKIKSVSPIRGNDFYLKYRLFQDISDSELGTASMNFNSGGGMMDIGIDSFDWWTSSRLWLAGLFSRKYDETYDLQDVRFVTEFDKRLRWQKYSENVAIRGSPSLKPHHYYRSKGKVLLDGKEMPTMAKLIHNPISALFEIINGKPITDFDMVASGKTSTVKISYQNVNDLVIGESEFPVPVIGKFRKVHAVLYHHIPILGYIKQQEPDGDESYIRGELSEMKVNGIELFNF